jgi:hypothetical protein
MPLISSGPPTDLAASRIETLEQAQAAAMSCLHADADMGDEVELIASETCEFDAGWVFYYQSARYLRTGAFKDMLVGNAPLFVARNGTNISFISYHRPVEVSIDAFICCGNPNALANAEVALMGWEPGAIGVPAIQAIRAHSSLGLGAAKKAVDNCLAGEVVTVRTTGLASAHELVAALGRLHFLARQTYGGDRRSGGQA